MKRGKRQIIQQPILFGSQQNSNEPPDNAFNNNNNTQKATGFKNQIQSNSQQVKQQIRPAIVKQQFKKAEKQIKKEQVVIQNHQSAESKQNLSADDERKKRLQLLRQKFLKKGPNQTPKVNQVKQQLPKNQPQRVQINNKKIDPMTNINTIQQIRKNNNTQHVQQKHNKVQQNKEIIVNGHNSNKNQIKKYEQETRSKNQSQIPISKPTQIQNTTDQTIKKVPPPPPPAPISAKQKRVPQPPPPKSLVSVNNQKPIQQDKNEQRYDRVQNTNQEINQIRQVNRQNSIQDSSIMMRKEAKVQKNKKQQNTQPKTSQTKNKTDKHSSKLKQQNIQKSEKLKYIIKQWIFNPLVPKQNKKNERQSKSKITSIIDQISQNHNSYVKRIIQNFMINNKIQYSLQQSKFVSQQLQKASNISEVTRLYFSIKCGADALQSNQGKIFNNSNDTDSILGSIVQLKQYLLDTQVNQFVHQFMNSNFFVEETIPRLVNLASQNSPIYQRIQSFQFQDSVNIASTLLQMKKILNNEQVVTTYLKLINLIIHSIQESQILQQLLKLVNNITMQSAYQMKKQIKKKIIEKIDRSTNGNPTINGNTMVNTNYDNIKIQEDNRTNQSSYISKSQKDNQKGLGINIMGYVNQAFKKIASQIPDKNQPSNSSSNIQQPKQTIVWDPNLGRYLINGKVPEDERGSVFDSTNANQNKQKKKPPPPPPRPGAKPKQPKPLTHNSQETTQPVSNIEQKQTQVVKSQQKINYQQTNSPNVFPSQQKSSQNTGDKPPPPPPARVGIKGLGKKPKLQQFRYAQ